MDVNAKTIAVVFFWASGITAIIALIEYFFRFCKVTALAAGFFNSGRTEEGAPLCRSNAFVAKISRSILSNPFSKSQLLGKTVRIAGYTKEMDVAAGTLTLSCRELDDRIPCVLTPEFAKTVLPHLEYLYPLTIVGTVEFGERPCQFSLRHNIRLNDCSLEPAPWLDRMVQAFNDMAIVQAWRWSSFRL